MAGLELATAYVSLAVSGQGLRGDVDKMLGQATKGQGQKQGSRLGGAIAGGFKKAAIGGFAGAGVVAGAALAKGFGRLKSLDDARGKLEGLGHSTKAVDGIMKDALKSVKGTAFGMDEAASGASSMVASGIKPGKELTKTLTLVGDAATIAGTDFSSMSGIFSKAAATNKVQGDILAQLGDQGIPVLQFLSKEMGVSAEEVSKLASAGKVDFKTFQSAMQDGLGGAALKSGETFSGSMKNAGAALGRLGASVLSGVFPQMKDGFSGLTDLLDRMGPAAEVWGKRLGGAIRIVSGYIGGFVSDFKAGDGAAGALRTTLEAVAGFVTGTVVPTVKNLAGWAVRNKDALLALGGAVLAGVVAFKAFMFIKTVIAVVKAARLAVLAFNASLLAYPLGLVAIAIGILVGALIYLYRNNESVRKAIDSAWASIKKSIAVVVEWVKTTGWPILKRVFSAIGSIVKWLWSSVIKPAFGAIWGVAKSVFGWLKTTAWPMVKAAFTNIANAAKWLWKKGIKPAFDGIKAVISWWYNNVVKRYFALVRGAIRVLAAAAVWLWKKGVKPAFTGIVTVASWMWKHIKQHFANIANNAKWLWGHIKSAGASIRGGFQAIGNKAKWLWDKGVKGPFNRMKSGFASLKKAAIGSKDAIVKQFGKIRGGIESPIKKIMTFIDKRFISKVKAMFHGVGLGSLSKDIPYLTPGGKGYAAGGYTGPGGKYAPAGVVHKDEFVLRKEATNKLRKTVGLSGLDRMNRTGEMPGYAIGGKVEGLNKRFLDQLGQFNDAAGGRYSVNSGYRSVAHQRQLYNRYLAGNGPVAAKPGSSQHNFGLAADLAPGNARDVHGALAKQFGLAFTVPSESWHIEPTWGRKGGDKGGSFIGNALSGFAGKVFDGGKETLTAILDRIPGADTFWGKMAIAPMKTFAGGAFSKLKEAAAVFGDGGSGGGSGGAPGKGVERWRPTVLKALGMMGLSDKYANSTLRRMMQESGGNPRAVNNWDSNATKGTPSKGLMQVIDPTFRAYAKSGYNKDIYDPLSNILASMRYAQSTYGTLWSAYDRKGGYSSGGLVAPPVFDNGGTLAPGLNLVHNKLGKPEPLVRADQSMSGGATFNLHDVNGVLIGAIRGEIDTAAMNNERLARRGA